MFPAGFSPNWGRAVPSEFSGSPRMYSCIRSQAYSSGETNKAFEWLERAYQERDPGLNQLKLDPLLKSLRSEPRYTELLTRMGLPT
jgi:cell division inhibitor SulA